MKRMKVGTVILIEIISLVLALLLITGVTEIGVLVYVLDLPTLLILLVLALPALFANGLIGDFLRLFQRIKTEKKA